MSIEDDLYRMEKTLWTGSVDDYRSHLDDTCLTVFTEMAGVMDKEKIAQSAGGGKRWSDLKMARKGFIEPTDEMAIISYEASARRADGKPYSALVSSGYVRRGQDWKMTFHQQTPMESK